MSVQQLQPPTDGSYNNRGPVMYAQAVQAQASRASQAQPGSYQAAGATQNDIGIQSVTGSFAQTRISAPTGAIQTGTNMTQSVNTPQYFFTQDGQINYAMLDDATQAQSKFDHGVARDYVLGNTTNPMVVGLAATNGRNSDARIFAVDKNVTIKALADPVVFHDRCAVILQKMIDVVPATVTLTDPIQPYEVKPVNPQLIGCIMSFLSDYITLNPYDSCLAIDLSS